MREKTPANPEFNPSFSSANRVSSFRKAPSEIPCSESLKREVCACRGRAALAYAERRIQMGDWVSSVGRGLEAPIPVSGFAASQWKNQTRAQEL